MAWIRITTTLVVCALLNQISFVLMPVIHFFTSWVLLLALAWLIGTTVTKKLILSRMPRVDPAGRAILITGCDHGFGYLAAVRLTDMGFFVFACCLNAQGDGAEKLRKQVKDQRRLTLLQMDVTKVEEIEAAEKKVRETLAVGESGVSELYAVINNAGIMLTSPIETATRQDFERQFAVNTMGPVNVTRALLPLLRASKGRIVTLSSIVARISMVNVVPYAMSKAATSKFVEGLQVELPRFGIKAISIEPWAVCTNLVMGQQLLQGLHKNWAAASDEIRDAYGAAFPTITEKGIKLLQNLPLNTTEDMVIADIVDAITSPEPELVYRVVKPSLAWLFWIEDDYLPWHVSNTIRWLNNKLLDLIASFT